MEEKILFILTGGTLESVFKHSRIPAARARVEAHLRKANASGMFEFSRVSLKDSRDLADDDRDGMAAAIKSSDAKKVIITHGTYTMVETAKYLKKRIGREKTVVLTGSFAPLSRPDSDAKFNLGYAVAAAQLLPHGIYICMNGKVFKPENARKNSEKRRFETCPGSSRGKNRDLHD